MPARRSSPSSSSSARRSRSYRPREGATQTFDDALPLEARVERRPIGLRQRGRPISLDLRLLMGRYWLKLIAASRTTAPSSSRAYPITAPDPDDPADADRARTREAWQAFAAVAGRAHGRRRALSASAPRPGAPRLRRGRGARPGDQPALDTRADASSPGSSGCYRQPPATTRTPGSRSRLEYRFACSSPDRPAARRSRRPTSTTTGTSTGTAFDVDPRATRLGLAADGDPTDVRPSPTTRSTLIPAPVTFDGMPNTRWWAFEDRRTNFGDVDAGTTDLAKLLFLEFGLVYANDWFLVPLHAAGRHASPTCAGSRVTNVFGERFWIEPAGAGADDDWQRWSMFTVNVKGDGAASRPTRACCSCRRCRRSRRATPIEEVVLIRDEMANMVWGVERTIPLPERATPSAAPRPAARRCAFLERDCSAHAGARRRPRRRPTCATRS